MSLVNIIKHRSGDFRHKECYFFIPRNRRAYIYELGRRDGVKSVFSFIEF